jgi:23S rRNA pseudouridine1911/1915/1917 synthase
MTHIGHPLIGDSLYGGGLTQSRRAAIGPAAADFVATANRQALHAFSLGFRHPATAESLSFEIGLPKDLNRLKTLLEAV